MVSRISLSLMRSVRMGGVIPSRSVSGCLERRGHKLPSRFRVRHYPSPGISGSAFSRHFGGRSESRDDESEAKPGPMKVTIANEQAGENLGNDSETPAHDIDLDRSLYTKEVKVRMPEMDEYDARILKWYKKEGDVVLRDDSLCDIATDSFDFTMQTEDEHPAIMGPILVPASETEIVPDDTVICILLHKEEPKEEEKKDE